MIAEWVVVFDWDGTLINSLDIKIHNAGWLLAQHFGCSNVGIEAAYRRHSGIPRRQLFAAICADNGLTPLDEAEYALLSRAFSDLNRTALSDTSRPGLLPADTRPTLERLNARGYPLYISSSADAQEIREVAAALGLSSFFQEILGSQPGFGKGRQHVDYVLSRQAVPREKIVFIGDDPVDIQLGRAAGVITLAKTGTYPAERLAQEQPDAVLDSLGQLLPWLDQTTGIHREIPKKKHAIKD